MPPWVMPSSVEALHVPGDHGLHQLVLGRQIHAAIDIAIGSLGVVTHAGVLREALHAIGALHPRIKGQPRGFVLVGHLAEVVPRTLQRGFDDAVPVVKGRDAERFDGALVLASPDDVVAHLGHVRNVARGRAKGDADAAAPTRVVVRGDAGSAAPPMPSIHNDAATAASKGSILRADKRPATADPEHIRLSFTGRTL